MKRREFLQSSLVFTGALSSLPSILLGSQTARTPEQIAALDATPLGPALKIARSSHGKIEQLTDYEASFIKQELFGRKLKDTSIQVKVRHQPFSVYMLFGRPHEGREVIYVEGANSGELLAHETGIKSIVGTVSLEPNSERAMEDNHYSITRFGMKGLLESLMSQWETDTLIPGVQVNYFPKAKIGEIACKAIETKHPSAVKGTKFHLTRLYLDSDSGLPVRVQQYNFPKRSGGEPELHEEYTYLNVKTNVGLKDIDFDVSNPKYNF